MSARELAYVATFRGRASNQFHLTAEPSEDARAAALDRLEWDLRRSIAKSAAIGEGAPLASIQPRRPQPAPNHVDAPGP